MDEDEGGTGGGGSGQAYKDPAKGRITRRAETDKPSCETLKLTTGGGEGGEGGVGGDMWIRGQGEEGRGGRE